jgi:3',5'-cyclic AMP phosphodiesterase CpdA
VTRRRIAAILFLLLAAVAIGIRLLPPKLESGPYIVEVTRDAATVMRVHEGRVHEKRLERLPPGPQRFPVGGGGEVEFRTARPPGEAFTFVAIGDSGVTREHEGRPDRTDNQRALAAGMLALAPDFVMHTGDISYYHSERWKYGYQFFEPFQELLRRAPLFPTPGNHDTRDGLGSAYFELFPSSGPDPRFYSFDWGSVHFVSLDGSDDELPDTHPQWAWLDRDLAAVPSATGIVVFQHFPIWSTSWKSPEVNAARRVLPALKKYGVGLFMSGHHHYYERTNPIDGTTFLITGGGGAELYDLGGPQPWLATHAKRFHFVKLSVSADGSSAAVEAIDTKGEVFDRATIPLRAPRGP